MSKKSPQLRFEGFTDDWEVRKLGDVVGEIQSGNRLPKDSLTSGNIPYVVAQTKNEGVFKTISKKTLDYNGNPMKLFPGNSISFSIDNPEAMFYRSTEFYTSNIMRVIHADYLSHQQYLFILENMKSFTRGYDWSRKFSGPVVSNLEYLQPNEQEQCKIGSFILAFDNIITLHQRKLDLLKEQKKGYLQKMFPKNGAKVPELRFAGFADDWEERKLSSGLREYTDRVIVEDDKEYYQISVRNNFGGITLRGSKMGNKIGRKRQAKINLTKYPQTLIFTRQTVEQGGIGWVDKYCDGAIVTENMPTISLDTSVFSKYFLTNLFQTRIFYKNAILDNIEGGSAQIAIHESKFLSSTLLFPNLDEQQKIGQFFKQLDDTIDLHQRKLDLLKEQKKGFLQKMFV